MNAAERRGSLAAAKGTPRGTVGRDRLIRVARNERDYFSRYSCKNSTVE